MLHNLLPQQAMLLGLPLPKYGPIDQELNDGRAIGFGKFELGTLHTPQDTRQVPSALPFLVKTSASQVIPYFETVLVEPTSGGDADTIKKSIQQKLYHLPSAVQVVTGHGPETSIEFEKTTNPFVRYLA